METAKHLSLRNFYDNLREFDADWLTPIKEKSSKLAKNSKREAIRVQLSQAYQFKNAPIHRVFPHFKIANLSKIRQNKLLRTSNSIIPGKKKAKSAHKADAYALILTHLLCEKIEFWGNTFLSLLSVGACPRHGNCQHHFYRRRFTVWYDIRYHCHRVGGNLYMVVEECKG